MKQRISAEQLNELTPEKKEHLRELWKPKVWDVIYDECYKNVGTITEIEEYPNEVKVIFVHWVTGGQSDFLPDIHSLPLLSIGQMIEILGNNLYAMTQKENGWYVVIGEWNGQRIDSNELCDALWEALKWILRREVL